MATLPLTLPFTPGQEAAPIVRCYIATDDFSDSTPNWTDVTAKMRSYSTSRGRNTELEDFNAGTASVVLDNRDRAFDPTVQVSIRPLNRIWLFEEFSGERRDLFRGYAERYEQNWDPSGIVDATATVYAADEHKLLANQALPSSGTIASGTTEQQLGAILDLIGSRASRRFGLTSPVGNLAALSLTGQSALEAIGSVMSAEASDSGFFATVDGSLVFLPRDHRAGSPYNTVQAFFRDDGGAGLPYLHCELDYSDSFLFNSWTISRAGGATSISTDAASIASYGTRSNSRLELPFTTDGQVSILADTMRDKYKLPMIRATTIRPKMSDGDTAQNVLGRELMDRVRVLRTPPGGGAPVDQELFIQQIEFSGAPGRPIACTLGVSPL
jgi:hypothetical protein